jgi:hypothetical protein
MSLDGAITNLASWSGNVIMPTLAGGFFSFAVYRYSKGGAFEHYLYGGFGSLMCSGILRAIEGFVQHAGATNAEGYWLALDNHDVPARAHLSKVVAQHPLRHFSLICL